MRIQFDKKTITVNLVIDHNNYLISGNEKDQSIMRDLRLLEGKYEPHVLNVLSKLMEPEWVMLDIGANIGVTSIMMAHYAPKERVRYMHLSPYHRIIIICA